MKATVIIKDGERWLEEVITDGVYALILKNSNNKKQMLRILTDDTSPQEGDIVDMEDYDIVWQGRNWGEEWHDVTDSQIYESQRQIAHRKPAQHPVEEEQGKDNIEIGKDPITGQYPFWYSVFINKLRTYQYWYSDEQGKNQHSEQFETKELAEQDYNKRFKVEPQPAETKTAEAIDIPKSRKIWDEMPEKKCTEPLVFPFSFVKWYSGMGDDAIIRAYRKYLKECTP